VTFIHLGTVNLSGSNPEWFAGIFNYDIRAMAQNLEKWSFIKMFLEISAGITLTLIYAWNV
jgi:hypothetical protein